MYKFIAALFSVCLLVSCSATGPYFSSTNTLGANDTGVYLYRGNYLAGIGMGATVSVDGRVIGNLRNNGFLFARLTPGSHVISIPDPALIFSSRALTYPIRVANKEVKYVKIGWDYDNGRMNHLAGGLILPAMNWSFTTVPASIGKREIQSLNLSK